MSHRDWSDGSKRRSPKDGSRGARLSAAMLSSGLMYNCQLCYDLGVTESSLSRWRSGGPMSVAMAVELAEKLGVSLEWLVKGGGGGDEADHAARDRDEVTNLFAALRPADRQLVLALNRALMNHQAAAEAA